MPRSDRTAIAVLLTREQHRLRAAFLSFVRRVRGPVVMAQVLRRIKAKDIDGAVELVSRQLQQTFIRSLSASFVRAAHDEYTRIVRQIGRRRLRKSALIRKQDEFDPGDPDAADIMDDADLKFIREFTRQQRKAVRRALSTSLRRGDSPTDAARSFRAAIGLTENQWAAVDNYRTLLDAQSTDALDRQLRDARFDRVVTSTFNRGDFLTDTQIDRMVARYTDRMLAYRADNIARTESHRAVSQARQTALSQLTDEYGIDEENVIRTWNATQDSRTRDTHAEMDGQKVTGFAPFRSPSGATLDHPGDPSAPPEETINCRCIETYDIAL